MKLFFIVTVVLLTGCSATRVELEPRLINNQTITYARGSSKLNSHSVMKPELTVIEYSTDEMLISLAVNNTTAEPILFAESNLTVELLASDELQAGTVYTFEQLAKEAADKGYDTAAQVGNTAAGIGVGFIPFGNIIYSIGRLFYSVGSQSSESYEERIDKLTFTQLNQNYLRSQTIEPGGRYSGILKIGFENDLEVGDTVIFSLTAGGEVEKFNFNCEQAEEK